MRFGGLKSGADNQKEFLIRQVVKGSSYAKEDTGNQRPRYCQTKIVFLSSTVRGFLEEHYVLPALSICQWAEGYMHI